MIKDQIENDLKRILLKLRVPTAGLLLEHPAEANHGDFATNVAFKYWKKSYPSAFDLATKIVNAWRSEGLPEYLAKIEIVAPGFINIWLQNDYFITQLERLISSKDRKAVKDKKGIMVEFAHPNTHKQFHIGHLRNLCLGEALCRLLEGQKKLIYRVNYQGDVGLHVAKCLWGLLKLKKATPRSLDKKIELLAKAYAKGHQAYETQPEAKKEMSHLNQQIYDQDKQILNLWQETRGWSLDYFAQIYQRLGTKFDRFYFESQMAQPGQKIVQANLKKGIFQKSEGAIIFPGAKYGLHNRVFINQQGLPTYEAKDLALAKQQMADFSPQRILHVVGPEQSGYFEVVFKALEKIMPKISGREQHLLYGWVRLKNGKMSSRTGQVVLGEWLLNEVKKRLKKKFKTTEKVAEVVAVGAVKYSLLKFSPLSEIAFDIEESINLEGNSGPYLQYTFARCQSVLEKAQVEKFSFNPSNLHLKPEEVALLRTIYKFPEVVLEAGASFAPNLIGNFLFDLAQKYNLFYNLHPILKADRHESRHFRLLLTKAVGQVIKNGLNLLGVEAPEKM